MRDAPKSVSILRRREVRLKKSIWHEVYQHRTLFLMLLPGLLLILVFNYGPLYGLQIAFKDYNMGLGIFDSPWIGFKHFTRFFTDPYALLTLKNTALISVYRLMWGFPLPILLALMLNEVSHNFFKRFVQTVTYLPHFISWIIISGLVANILSPSTGVVNGVLKMLGADPVYFMGDPEWFRTILVTSGIWKEAGWSAVIYLAALAGVDVQIYEAAIIDGASRIQRIRYITIPSIMPVVAITLLLSMGGIMNAGFDQIFNMYNPSVMEVSDIIDTYVYRTGLMGMQYSFTSAVGLFKSIVGLIMIVLVNSLTRRFGSKDYGLW